MWVGKEESKLISRVLSAVFIRIRFCELIISYFKGKFKVSVVT